jgi:hypothetical protein
VSLWLINAEAYAQAPAGTIVGVVKDPLGALIPAAQVTIIQVSSGLRREIQSNEQGDYSAPSLAPGTYEVTVEAPGFERVLREALVEAGFTTTVDVTLSLGELAQSITIDAASPQMRYDNHQVAGITTRGQIEGLPLNGRSFVELAKFEPGVAAPARTSNNRVLVPMLGAPGGQNGRNTRATVDGGSINMVGNGGVAMGFSQEVVQEVQVSTASFDLSTGMTASGALNVVTRSGTDMFQGDAFLFFRDHHLAAYPALERSVSNPDPFFQRRQFGASMGGPLRSNRLFFFGAYERNEQRAVFATRFLTPEFAPLSRITPGPTFTTQFSGRVDMHLRESHMLFVRHSHEGVRGFSPSLLNEAGDASYPSNWSRQPAWLDQSLVGLTSVLPSGIVNDLRFSYLFISNREIEPRPEDCPGCIGIGAPQITVQNAELVLGSSQTVSVLARRWHFNDSVAGQKGSHLIRFGIDWEYTRGGRTDMNFEPVTMTLFSPQNVRNYNARPTTPADLQVPIPASFRTLDDILQLPVRNFTVGIGDARVPQKNFGHTRTAHLFRLFYQDHWRVHPQLTLNYGLGWSFDRPLNYDLRKPEYLAPILGVNGLGPVQKNWLNFSPLAGVAWTPGATAKTIIRAGGGVYFDVIVPYPIADNERVSLLPRGVGRGRYPSLSIQNPSSGIPDVPQGTSLDFANPTLFTGARLMESLPEIRAELARRRGDPNNRDFSVTNIEADKQGVVVGRSVPNQYSIHANADVQRQLTRDFVLSVDFVWRRFVNTATGQLDFNRFRRASGPVMPRCSESERNDPRAVCATDSIMVQTSFGRTHYRGLLARADKRLSKGLQFLGSYAYSSNTGLNLGAGFNLDNWFENVGPLDGDVTHMLNGSGVVQLPFRFRLGFGVTYYSRPPFFAQLMGLDLNGDGTSNDLLPGTRINEFNRGRGKDDLRRRVDEFNRNWSGKTDARGTRIQTLQLPARFEFDDNFITQDLRLSRELTLVENRKLTLIGEVFNVLNIANLTGYSRDLFSAAFGQSAQRVSQVFGSGGPRAFQLALRLSF